MQEFSQIDLRKTVDMSIAWDDLMTPKRLKANSKTRMDMQDFERYFKKKKTF